MEKKSISKYFLVFLLVVVVYACYLVFRPFLGEFLIAAILVTLFYPLYERAVKFFRGRRNLAALVICLMIILIVILPLANFFFYTGQRLAGAYSDAVDFARAGGLDQIADRISQSPASRSLSSFGISQETIRAFLIEKADLAKAWVTSGSGALTLVSQASGIIAGTANFIVSIVIIIFSMFFFFADGKQMAAKLMYWTPLSNKYDQVIFKKFKDVSGSTIISTFITAFAQGLIGAVGFLIAGFPAFFAAIALAFASIIPYVGTALVWAPISIYLLLMGNVWQGVFLAIWGAVVIGNSDNLIRAYLIKDKAEVHPLFIVFSILGGLALFGFWGIFLGPLIISLAVTILHIYELEYGESLEK